MARLNDLSERVWIGLIIVMLASFAVILAYMASVLGYMGPSLEGPYSVDEVGEALEPGVRYLGDGVYEVNIIGRQWIWNPREINVKDPKLIIFRITSIDVIHGFQIVDTNINVMVIPGYVTVVKWVPPDGLEGRLLIICNEYCGYGHQAMYGYLVIEG